MPWVKYGLRSLQYCKVYLGSMCTAPLILWMRPPQLPPSTASAWAQCSYTRALLLVSLERRHLFVTPWLMPRLLWVLMPIIYPCLGYRLEPDANFNPNYCTAFVEQPFQNFYWFRSACLQAWPLTPTLWAQRQGRSDWSGVMALALSTQNLKTGRFLCKNRLALFLWTSWAIFIL